MNSFNSIGPVLALIALCCASVAEAQPENDAPLQFIVHLETGPAWQIELPPAEQAGFAEHSANMQAMRKKGLILLGARYEDYGMLIMTGESIEQIEALMDQDPGVQAGLFIYHLAELSVFYSWQAP